MLATRVGAIGVFARLMLVDRLVELLVEELDRVRKCFERGGAIVRGFLGGVGRFVYEQRTVALGTDATVADFDEIG